MTDRHSGYVVTLTHDIREDDAEAIILALRMVKGVASVEPVLSDFPEQMARMRVRSEVRRRLYEAIDGALDA